MTLYIIGIGLSDEKDITVRGLEVVKAAKRVFLENYTSKLNITTKELEKFYGKEIIEADRTLVEQKADQILEEAKDDLVAFLVIGDALSATTHYDLMMRAKKLGIKVKIIHNASIMNAIAITGLQLYKFGKTTSIPYPQENFFPETSYDVLEENSTIGAHTLMLLDLRPAKDEYMKVAQAISILKEIEEKKQKCLVKREMKILACSAIGSSKQIIRYGTINELLNVEMPNELNCIIFPGKLHFIEEEALEQWKI